MNTKKKILLAGIVVLALAAIAWWLQKTPQAQDSPGYSQVKVQRADITSVVSATGTVNPIKTVQVGSQVSGTIQHLYADFNDEVKKEQVIAQIDPAVFRAKLAEAEANVKSAEAGVEKAKVGVADAKRELDRQKNLFKKQLVAENLRDAARFSYDSARVEQQVKEAALAQAKAAREREQVNLAYSTIYAPIDGVIISRDVDVGQTVAASLQAPTLFTIAKDLTKMQVEAEVDESFIGQVREGMPVSFTVFAYPGREFRGVVKQVRLHPTVDAGVVKYNNIIYVDNADLALKPGMTATVSIEADRRQQVLQVPPSALRFVPDLPEDELAVLRKKLKRNQRMLWQVDGDDLVPIVVTTGIRGERTVEVISDQLHAGMQVATPEKRKVVRKRSIGLSLF